MRSEQEMLNLIIETARTDERIRAVILNGSRANPNALKDIFQDFDIVYLVTDVAPFKNNLQWIDRFGERMILQTPDDMGNPLPGRAGYAYLMQFTDGNRIDLTLYPVAKLRDMEQDSQSILLLDKDGLIAPFPPASDKDYLPNPPTAKSFADCCNEFWWVSTYVAKGLWREETTYTKAFMDDVVREELMKMLTWYIGVRTNFTVNPGKLGKYFQQYLEPDLWQMLLQTYAATDCDHNWDALLTMTSLFRMAALSVAEHFGFAYPTRDDERVTAHLHHVRNLPKDANQMY